MHGHRVTELMIFTALLTLAGCKDRSAVLPPPPPPAPAPKVALNVDTDTVDQKPGKKFDVHTAGLAKGTVVTWTFSSQFYIEFEDKQNPCDPPLDLTHPNDYPSTSSALFVATCTIAADPDSQKPHKFKYYVREGSPSTPSPLLHAAPARAIIPFDTGHCEGCFLDN